MTNTDTLKLLNTCNSGLIMGIASIEQVLHYARSSQLKDLLIEYINEHKQLLDHIHNTLLKYDEEGKEPCPITRAMSWISTNFKIATHNPDQEIADIMHDGCNMGIKSVCKYLNQYTNADKESRRIAEDIIKIEDEFLYQLRNFL